MEKINVLVLFGGVSGEHEVSLISAKAVLDNIDMEKYNPITVGITKKGDWLLFEGDTDSIANGKWENESTKEAFISPIANSPLFIIEGDSVKKVKIDVVYPALHGDFGEDGKLQGLFESAQIPFVGPGCLSSAVCMDKAMTKLVLKNYGIPQAKSLLISKPEYPRSYSHIQRMATLLGYPLFVKPSAAGSSLGASKVNDENELRRAIENALKVCDRVLIEEYINGKEIEVAVIGNDNPIASLCGEIAPGADFYDYDTKYKSDTASYYIPARLELEESDKVREYAVKIYKALCCKGLSRVDFFVGDAIYFNEINTLPGFTPISMYPKLMMNLGLTYSEIIDRLISLATEK